MGNGQHKHRHQAHPGAPEVRSFDDLLRNTTIEDLSALHKEHDNATILHREQSHSSKTPRPAALVVINRSENIAKAFQVLNANFILSAPVYDSELKSYFGFVDVLDLVALLADKFNWNNPEEFFKETAVDKAIDYSHCNAVIELRPGASLHEMIGKMLRVKVHRVAMINDQNQFQDIITQSDLVTFVVRHIASLDAHTLSRTVEDLNIITKRVVTVTENEETLTGFRLMVEKKVGAIGVVGAGSDKLLGQLAAGVLRGIDETNYTDLRLPVKEFLRKHSVTGFNTCKPTTVLSDLLQNLNKFRIHRVFVVDDDGRCAGIITLSDIIACLYHREAQQK